MSGLRTKSIHELRAIAQGYGLVDIFDKTQPQLVQMIEGKQVAMQPQPDIVPERNPYDARLSSRTPSRRTSEEEIKEALADHVRRGLHLSFPEPERWEMRFGQKMDTGNVRIPLRVILHCADGVMR